MSEVIAWSLVAIFAVLAIFFAVSYAFECRERVKLESERMQYFVNSLGKSKSLLDDIDLLKYQLRSFQLLCQRYGCVDSKDLHDLIIDLRDKLLLQEKKTYKESRRCCLAWLEYFNLREDEFGGEYYRRWIKRWTKLSDYYKEKQNA